MGLGFGGIALVLAASVLLTVNRRLSTPLYWWGGAWMLTALSMLAYAKIGKFRQRERILDLADVRGTDTVLDVGTGKGLLAVGAAKRGARAIGIDIFQTKDLSGNAIERTRANVDGEEVADRCEIRHEDARTLTLADGSVDVVVSNLCLHNIAPRPERERALAEIVRVLKPGGRAVLSDFVKTREYAAFLRGRGLTVSTRGPFLLDTFFPLRIVVAQKPFGA